MQLVCVCVCEFYWAEWRVVTMLCTVIAWRHLVVNVCDRLDYFMLVYFIDNWFNQFVGRALPADGALPAIRSFSSSGDFIHPIITDY